MRAEYREEPCSTALNRVRGMPSEVANLRIGMLMAVAGLLGILLGAWLPDLMLRKTRRAHQLWCCLAVGVAVPFGLVGLLTADKIVSMGLMFVAMLFMASVLGPYYTVTANVVPATQRAAGFALSIFLIHAFGDIISPPLIGTSWITSHDKCSPQGSRLVVDDIV